MSRESLTATLRSLTGLRFFAAMLVVVHHVGQTVLRGNGELASSLGYVGVTFFFILSGFVLTWSYQPGTSRRVFYGRRFARVWPLHALTWAAAILIAVLAENRGVSAVAASVNLLLVQAWIPKTAVAFSINQVSWSLSCELLFYAAFPLAIIWATAQTTQRLVRATALMFGALALAIAGVLALGVSDYLLLYANPAGRMYQFLLGIVLAVAVKRGLRFGPRLGGTALLALMWLSLLTVAATWGGHLNSFGARHWPADLAVVPVAACLIVVAATNDIELRGSWFASAVAVRLGEWSFALYLCHFLVFRLGLQIVQPANLNGAGRAVFSAALIAVSVLLSGLLYSLFERPVERWLRSRLPTVPAAAAPLAAVAPA